MAHVYGRFFFAFVAVTTLLSWPAAAPAQPSPARADACLVAQIVGLAGLVSDRGGIYVLTPLGNGRYAERPARLRQCLQGGQRVRVTAPEPAEATIRLVREIRRLKADSPDFVVPPRQEPSFWSRFSNFARALGIFSSSRESIPVETYGRRTMVAMPHPLLPIVEQVLPARQQSLVVVWQGPTPFVELRNAGNRIAASQVQPATNFAVLTGLNITGRSRLLIGDSIIYVIRAVDSPQVPEPQWMEGRTSRTEDERVARALWLLTDGPAQWRLFALGELEGLRTSSFAAERIWEWVWTSGDAEGMPDQ